jgi:hypothetical protein
MFTKDIWQALNSAGRSLPGASPRASGSAPDFHSFPAEQEPMGDIQPIRRVVTGNDAQGRSRVLFDSAAPNVKASPFQQGTSMTDIWVFHACPAVITGERDDGNLPFHFEPPRTGGHLRRAVGGKAQEVHARAQP